MEGLLSRRLLHSLAVRLIGYFMRELKLLRWYECCCKHYNVACLLWALVSAALTRFSCVINFHELCDVINMVAARESVNSRKEEDDASGSLFKRTKGGSRAQSGNISPGSKKYSTSRRHCLLYKQRIATVFILNNKILSFSGRTEIISVLLH